MRNLLAIIVLLMPFAISALMSCNVKRVGEQHFMEYGVDFNDTTNQANYAWYKLDRYYNYKCCSNTSVRCGMPEWISDPIFTHTLYNYNMRFPFTDAALVPYEDICNGSRLYRNMMAMHHAFVRGAWHRTLSRLRNEFNGRVAIVGCEYEPSYIYNENIPVGCHWAVTDSRTLVARMINQKINVIEYGYYTNDERGLYRRRIPFWLECEADVTFIVSSDQEDIISI